ncbi:TonB-dependent receptor [Sphingomonas sp. GB1N7]|uniref:TonB-dependent receptor n=1 Tax=Parasphingomonas caseinilytica TaxID=3096158 RepID=UPI002FCC5EC9
MNTSHRRPSFIKPAFLAMSCVGAFASSAAWANEPADTNASADAGDSKDQEILVNGQRLKEQRQAKDVAPIVNTPRSVILLPKEIIEQTGSVNLQDALRTVPGITFGAAEGGNPIGDRPFIRGFDSQGSIYVDSVRDIGSQSREVFAIESVQVVRGSDSTLGGRGSAGGTINILSKQPQLGTFGSVSGSYGEADFKRVTGDLNLKLSDMAAFRISGVWHDQDVAGRDALYSRRWGVAPSVTLGLGTPTRLTVGYYYLESHELPDSGIPYLYSIGNAPGTGNIASRPAIGQITTAGGRTGTVSRNTFYGLTDRDFRDTRTHQVTVRAEHDFGGVTLRNTARYNHNYQAYIFTQPDDTQGNVYGTAATNPTTGAAGTRGDLLTGGYVWRRANTRYGYSESLINQTDLFGKVNTGSIEHSFSVGTEFAWEKTRRGTFVLATGATAAPRCNTSTVSRYNCTDLFNPNPSDPWVNYVSDTSNVQTPITKIGTAGETQNDANTRAVYAFDSITIVPALIVNLGARYDRFQSKLTVPIANGLPPVSRVDELFNWQAGAVFKPTKDTSLYASYATAATPPNALLGEGQEGNALPTTTTTQNLLDQLKVQKTKSYEVGAKASLFGERLQLGAAVFQTDITNARTQVDANTVAFLGNTRIRGVELNVSGTILPGWTVFGGYTHLDPKIIDAGNSALTAPALTRTVGGVVITDRAAQIVYVPSVNNGKQTPQTAKNSFTLTSNVDVTPRLQVGGTAIYMDKQFGGYSDNRSATQNAAGVVTINAATKLLSREIPSYWRFDARASYRVTDNVSLSVNAQNLTNKVYFSQAYANHYATIAPARTVFGTVNVKF